MTAKFKGPHLWVNHDAEHLKAQPHRRQVFQHIQARYRPWKKREKNKALLESLRLPPIPQRSRNNSDSSEESEKEALPSPLTILKKGNSDPFSVYSVKIGAAENELVCFYRDVFLPAQYGQKRLQIPNSDRMRLKDWEDCIGGFRDEGIAHGLLARWGSMIGRCTASIRTAAIEHQWHSTQLLRKKIELGDDKVMQTNTTYLHMNMLYSVETINRNLEGCLAHGRMFRQMFEDAWEQGTLDFRLLMYQSHNDVQTASMFLVPPVFGVDEFLPNAFEVLRKQIAAFLPTPDEANMPCPLDGDVEGVLAGHFDNVRNLWHLFRSGREDSGGAQETTSEATVAWGIAQAIIFLGRFVNFYLSTTYKLSSDDLPEEVRQSLLVQQYLSLAAIWLVKAVDMNPVVLGVPIFDSAAAILPPLRLAIEEHDLLAETCGSGRSKYRNAKLWALYVGAMVEQGFPSLHGGSGVDAWKLYFNRRLALYADELKLAGWEEVKPILQGFLYIERVAPNGEEWFDENMERYRGTKDGSRKLLLV